VARNLWQVRLRVRATGAPPGRSVAAEMTVGRQRLGRRAEDLVVRRLRTEGWRIVDRNVRVAAIRGELDLIAVDGRALVFVEVKARRDGSGVGPETPALAVGPRKRAKIRGLAAAWLRERGYAIPRHRDLRFDVIGLRFDREGRIVEWEHIEAAF
jgi:putative endonuclease